MGVVVLYLSFENLAPVVHLTVRGLLYKIILIIILKSALI